MIDVGGGVGILASLVLVFVRGEGKSGYQLFRHVPDFNWPARSSRMLVPKNGRSEGLCNPTIPRRGFSVQNQLDQTILFRHVPAQ